MVYSGRHFYRFISFLTTIKKLYFTYGSFASRNLRFCCFFFNKILFQTNSGKKRREFRGKGTGDAEDKSGGESHREDFPKGKRKARKRRRLELKGRAVNIKDGIGSRKKRRIQGPGSASDNDNDILRPSAASLSRSSYEEGNEKNHSSDGESQETLEADTATSSSSSSESE